MGQPPAWFKQKVIVALRQEQAASLSFFDGVFIFRFLGGAAFVMAVSLSFFFAQMKNPYLKMMEMNNTTIQTEQLP